MEKYYFFWEAFSPFSNWHLSDFTYKGVKFNCSEQAMMWEKCLCSGDEIAAERVLMESDPRNQKAIGRSIKNFNVEKWDSTKYEIVKDILRHKFAQNPSILKTLKKHAGETFVEASPYDRIWGIGFTEADAIANKSEWGTNLLGKMLTELATEL
jgi:ribA/ribD-fused uncharacterized protein